MYKANYDIKTGAILGWYRPEIHSNIPQPTIDVSDEQHADFFSRNQQFKVVDGQLVFTDPPAQSLADVQAAAWTAIKAERDRRERLLLDYLGKQLDFDSLSSDRLNWAIEAARSAMANGTKDFSLEWTCSDNTSLQMTAQQIVDLPIAVAQRSDGLHRRARELRAAIDAAKTVDEVQAIKWE